jgi:mRNA interferase YafQ
LCSTKNFSAALIIFVYQLEWDRSLTESKKFMEKTMFKESKRITKRNPQLKEPIIEVLLLLAEDPFTPSLKSHKLSGNLAGLWSCSVAYDCRIIFEFSEDNESVENIYFTN